MYKYLILLYILNIAGSAFAATGEAIYQAKCSTCHGSGAGQAPRLSVRADWPEREARGRAAMHVSALKGIAFTAMAAKGGYAELTDEEVRATVDYMLARVGFRDVVAAKPAEPAPAASAAAGAPVDDATLVTRVAEALQQALAPTARIEHYAG
jgi:cytochrome c5